MLRVHLTADDLARVRFAPRPAPLQELNAALSMLVHPRDALLFGRWRNRLLRALPPAAEPLADLVPLGVAPRFLDVFHDTLADGLDAVRAAPSLVRPELERVHGGRPPAPWVHRLHEDDPAAWRLLRRAQRAAFDTVLAPVWPLVQDLHRAEFTRHAVTAAEHGTGAALAALVPGGRLRGTVWELPASTDRDLRPAGRGLLLLPTFHWTGHPLVADLPHGPLGITYPAGPGLPLDPAGAEGPAEPLSAVLGRTRLDVLLLLAHEHTTTGLARRLGVSNATASAHATALRGAGLVTSTRRGRSVLHRRTALGDLLVRR
ncbi:ArsR/SmtB family transcription factor [Streptomyces sp. URMC 126]|uniref:ArsR/SmtB family transcription factor n=1 Tax=Streptomyces sp. URMC 126 TaxID=3423401 RepID=UPI003F1AA74A